jgi:parvulin-like peptidyl-prolyl isomerase
MRPMRGGHMQNRMVLYVNSQEVEIIIKSSDEEALADVTNQLYRNNMVAELIYGREKADGQGYQGAEYDKPRSGGWQGEG